MGANVNDMSDSDIMKEAMKIAKTQKAETQYQRDYRKTHAEKLRKQREARKRRKKAILAKAEQIVASKKKKKKK